jgi:hypothetical protein
MKLTYSVTIPSPISQVLKVIFHHVILRSRNLSYVVQAATPANTYVISGQSQTKKLQDLLPSIASQLGPESFQTLKKMAAEFNSNEA